jgi:hypothetical protein
MPKISDPRVLQVLTDKYFDHHAAMHLCREGLIPNPEDKCPCCDEMKPVGESGSGKEFLDMHNEMIRVFHFLLDGDKEKPPVSYTPVKWDLDDYNKLPGEIINLFSQTAPNYLAEVFDGVYKRIQASTLATAAAAIDDLGQFIEHPAKQPDVRGAGFHDTLHDYLGSKEGGFAKGAEMNKLRAAMYNDYFWSLHDWIDGQYQRISAKCTQPFSSKPLDPTSTDCMTSPKKAGPAGMSHAAGM